MPKPKKQRIAPFSLRLTPEERARLERDAGGMALGAYIRWRLFDPDKPPPKTRGKFPVKDHTELSQLLGLLGQSGIANNINALAGAARSGSLPVTPETEAALRRASGDIHSIREMLIKALGLSERPS